MIIGFLDIKFTNNTWELSLPNLLELFYGLLFDWARVWGFTSEKSLAAFVVSLRVSPILV